jgi:uncharacterized damage-inducible protein DinB
MEADMLSTQMFHELFEYHYALYDRIWESLEALTDAHYHQSHDYSRGSLHDQMFHAVATDRAWLRGIQGYPRKPAIDPADYPHLQAVRQLFEEVRVAVEAYIASLTETELERVPEQFYGPVWQVLLHVVNHGTDHRAQILRLLHEFEVPTFDQDYILWAWRRKR